MEVGCMIFGMKHKKGQKNVRNNGSHNAHSPVLATEIDKFMVRWPRTPTTLFCLLHMRNNGKINLNEISC